MTDTSENKKVFSIDQVEEPENIHDVVFNLMVNPNLDAVNYFNDFSEDGDLANSADSDDAGIFVTDSGQMMAMTTHALHHHFDDDPEIATEILISRAVRRMACYGVTPLAVSASLYHINVADPYGQVLASGAKTGLMKACEAFGLKVSDRKIRFDCFPSDNKIPPTIIISLTGSVDDKNKILTHRLKSKGNNIFMIGRSINDINSSEYIEFFHQTKDSPLPVFDLDMEVKLSRAMKGLIQNGLISSASPVGKGGLFFSLMRAGMDGGLGFDITTDAEIRKDAFLFGEAMGRLIVGVTDQQVDAFVDYMQEIKVPFFTLGHVTRGEIRIDDESFGFIDKMIPLQ